MQVGMVGGLGTLCGQAYGAKQYHKLGVYLQQSWIVLVVVTSLLSPLFIFAAPILKFLGQDKNVAERSGNVALWFILLIFLYVVFYSCNAYLQSQSKNFVLSCFAVVSLLQHIFFCWLLTVKFEFGVSGVMVSTVLALFVPNVCQLVYVMFGGCRETWKGLTAECFKDLGLTVKLLVSSGVMFWLGLFNAATLSLLLGFSRFS